MVAYRMDRAVLDRRMDMRVGMLEQVVYYFMQKGYEPKFYGRALSLTSETDVVKFYLNNCLAVEERFHIIPFSVGNRKGPYSLSRDGIINANFPQKAIEIIEGGHRPPMVIDATKEWEEDFHCGGDEK